MESVIYDLGLIDFQKAWDFQKDVLLKVKSGLLDQALIIAIHHPVITLGRQGRLENIRLQKAELLKRDIMVFAVERGGDVTYHGPGQLLSYLICNLREFNNDLHFFLRSLEQIAVSVLADFGITARTIPGLTGVWVDDGKIASVGIAVKNWITYHGLAINIKEKDLANFSLIRPCGMDIKMTSMETVLHKEISIEDVKDTLIRRCGYDQGSLAGIRTGN
jgi:lipoate-protein ligase B